MTSWNIDVEIKSSVPLMCDLEMLNKLGISYTGTTTKTLSDEEKVKMFSLDFTLKGTNITIYI